jgi:membrane protease YdiL (CAAX protease family)
MLWGFFVWGSFIGGALVTAIADGRGGLKTFFSRIVRWRVGIQWYAIAIFLPVALRLGAFGLNILSGASVSPSFQWPEWGDLIFEMLIVFFIVAMGEEPGFRGFALPRMLAVRTAVSASLILGVLHAIWHLPLFILGQEPPIKILLIISAWVFVTWIFNHTNGSVFIVMILHTAVNFWAGFFNPFFEGADALRQEIWLTVMYVAMAILLVMLTGRELGRKPEVAMDTMATDQALPAD